MKWHANTTSIRGAVLPVLGTTRSVRGVAGGSLLGLLRTQLNRRLHTPPRAPLHQRCRALPRTRIGCRLNWRPVHQEFGTEFAADALAALEPGELAVMLADSPALVPQEVMVRTIGRSSEPEALFHSAMGSTLLANQPFCYDLSLSDLLARSTRPGTWPRSIREEIDVRYAAFLYVNAFRRESLYREDVDRLDLPLPEWELQAARYALTEHFRAVDDFPSFDRWHKDAQAYVSILTEGDVELVVSRGLRYQDAHLPMWAAILEEWSVEMPALPAAAVVALEEMLDDHPDLGDIRLSAIRGLLLAATADSATEAVLVRLAEVIRPRLSDLTYSLPEVLLKSDRLRSLVAADIYSSVGEFVATFDPNSDAFEAAEWLATVCATAPDAYGVGLRRIPRGDRTVEFLLVALDKTWIAFCDSPVDVFGYDVHDTYQDAVVSEILSRGPSGDQLFQLHSNRVRLSMAMLREIALGGELWAVEALHMNGEAEEDDLKWTGELLAAQMLQTGQPSEAALVRPGAVVAALGAIQVPEAAVANLVDLRQPRAFAFYEELVARGLLSPGTMVDMLGPDDSGLGWWPLAHLSDLWPEFRPALSDRFEQEWMDEETGDYALAGFLEAQPWLREYAKPETRLCATLLGELSTGRLDLCSALRLQDRLKRIAKSFHPLSELSTSIRSFPSASDVDDASEVLGVDGFRVAVAELSGVDPSSVNLDSEEPLNAVTHEELVWLLCLARTSPAEEGQRFSRRLFRLASGPGGVRLVHRGLVPRVDPIFLGISPELDSLCRRMGRLQAALGTRDETATCLRIRCAWLGSGPEIWAPCPCLNSSLSSNCARSRRLGVMLRRLGTRVKGCRIVSAAQSRPNPECDWSRRFGRSALARQLESSWHPQPARRAALAAAVRHRSLKGAGW